MKSTCVSVPSTGIDFRLTLAPLAMLAGDPTIRLSETTMTRATVTPEGPGAIRAQWNDDYSEIELNAYGAGGPWLLEHGPALMGMSDDASSFTPADPVVAALWSRFGGDRIPRTSTLWHDLAWTIVQQRVHRRDAARQWRSFVQGKGTPVEGVDGLLAPPDPKGVARCHPGELRHFGLDLARAQALINAATAIARIQESVDGSFEPVRDRLLSTRGIGPWTVACVNAFTWGNPDVVITGDSGIPSLIASTLVGERRASDERMLELLEPYRPHRYRVLRLCFAARLNPAGYRLEP